MQYNYKLKIKIMDKLIAVVDVQPEIKNTDDIIPNLVQYKEIPDGNIGLEKIYELLKCKSRLFQPVYLGVTSDGNQLYYLVDEEGTFGQWSRGILISDENGYNHQLFGNGIFVKVVGEDMVGWDSKNEMADDLRKYVTSIKIFDENLSDKT